MNDSNTSVTIRLVALLALIVVTYNLWDSHVALEKAKNSQKEASQAKIGSLEATSLFYDMEVYRGAARPRPGAPLTLEDIAPHDTAICQDVQNWNGVGEFYLLGHVPPPNQPYAVYMSDGVSVPDVQKHPEWEISARIRDGSLQPQ